MANFSAWGFGNSSWRRVSTEISIWLARSGSGRLCVNWRFRRKLDLEYGDQSRIRSNGVSHLNEAWWDKEFSIESSKTWLCVHKRYETWNWDSSSQIWFKFGWIWHFLQRIPWRDSRGQFLGHDCWLWSQTIKNCLLWRR